MRPEAVAAPTAALIALYRQSWEQLDQQFEELDRNHSDQAAFQQEVKRHAALLDRAARAWITSELVRIYVLGTGIAVLADFVWTAAHEAALAALAQEIFGSLTDATATMVASSLDLGNGFFAVMYEDGSKHGLAQHADAVIDAGAQKTFNTATLQAVQGQEFLVHDGPECGWTDHRDGDLADGTIRSREECEIYLIAHPHCVRSFELAPEGAVSTAPEEPVISERSRTALATRAAGRLRAGAVRAGRQRVG